MTREELEMLDIDELDHRNEELRSMVDAPDADLVEIEREVDVIKELREAKIAEREERKAMMTEVIEGKGETIEKEETRTMTNKEIRNTPEYIDAFAKYIKTGSDKECRALLTENVSGTVPVPEIVEGRVRTAWERDGITALVRKTFIKGNLKIGFEISGDDAVVHTEAANSAVTEEDLVLGIVELVPASIKKWISLSDEALDMSSSEFLDYIYDELTYRIAKKAADVLIEKIDACDTVSTATCPGVPIVEAPTIGLATIASARAQLSDEAENPVVVMNKKTYAAFKLAQATANYAQDIFDGMNVVFNSSIEEYDAATTGVTYAIVGDFGQGAQMNFPNGAEITFKYDDLSLAEKDLVKIVGREYVGIGVVAPNAFVKIQKDAE